MRQTTHCRDQAPTGSTWRLTLGERRRCILNSGHLINPTPVSKHFNQADHSINDVLLVPLQLIRGSLNSVQKGTRATPLFFSITLSAVRISLLFNLKIWCWRFYWSRSTKDPADPYWFLVVVSVPFKIYEYVVKSWTPKGLRYILGHCFQVTSSKIFPTFPSLIHIHSSMH